MYVSLVPLCDRKVICVTEETVSTMKNLPRSLCCQTVILCGVYLQKMFGESCLHLRPDLLRVLGRGWGFASQNASAARGSVKSVKYHNKGSLCSKKALTAASTNPNTASPATTDINQKKKKQEIPNWINYFGFE